MTILVTGATGNIGRMVVDHLLARGARDVRALTVDPERAALPDGVEVVRGSIRRPDSLGPALDGVERMYLAPSADTAADVLARARAAGVRHVVALTGRTDSWWAGLVADVEAAGVPWTQLRPEDFMENVGMWYAQIRATGEVREPDPDTASTPTAMTDIAEVAAVALTTGGHEGRSHDLTGPAAYSRRELVATLAGATGVPIAFVPSTPEETIAALEPTMGGRSEMFVRTVLPRIAASRAEPNTVVADLTGRPATTFAQWAAAHADEVRAAVTA